MRREQSTGILRAPSRAGNHHMSANGAEPTSRHQDIALVLGYGEWRRLVFRCSPSASPLSLIRSLPLNRLHPQFFGELLKQKQENNIMCKDDNLSRLRLFRQSQGHTLAPSVIE